MRAFLDEGSFDEGVIEILIDLEGELPSEIGELELPDGTMLSVAESESISDAQGNNLYVVDGVKPKKRGVRNGKSHTN